MTALLSSSSSNSLSTSSPSLSPSLGPAPSRQVLAHSKTAHHSVLESLALMLIHSLIICTLIVQWLYHKCVLIKFMPKFEYIRESHGRVKGTKSVTQYADSGIDYVFRITSVHVIMRFSLALNHDIIDLAGYSISVIKVYFNDKVPRISE